MPTSRAARFGAVLAMLWAAHDLADHVVQTDHQAEMKSTHDYCGNPTGAAGWCALAGHVGSYTAVQLLGLAALVPLEVRPSWRRVLAATAFSAGTHAVLDRRWPVRWVLEHTGSPNFARPCTTVTGVVELTVETSDNGRQVALGEVTATGPVGLPGPYVADQALHHLCLVVCALILAAGRR